jgi:hypothetical protein
MGALMKYTLWATWKGKKERGKGKEGRRRKRRKK